MSTPVLKAGALAYIDSMRSGLVPCKVLSIVRDDSGVVPRDVVKIVVTGARPGYPRGFVDDMLSLRIVVPRKAVFRTRGRIHPRIGLYKIEYDGTPPRCEPCLGMGYKGRYRKMANSKRVWKIETCRACGGRGHK